MNKFVRLLVILACALIGFQALAAKESFTGELRDMATDKLLYKFLSETERNGDEWNFKSTYMYPDGKLAVVESGTVKGSMVQVYEVDQQQTGEKAKVTVADGKVTFSMTDSKGRTKESKEDLDPKFVVGPTMSTVLRQEANWAKLLKGEKVKLRFGVWHRKETVGFHFYKNRDFEQDGKKLMNVVMNPTSWFIRQLVNDLTLTFDKETKKIISIKGRVSPKKKDGDSWKDLDAVTYYSYEAVPAAAEEKKVETQMDLGDE